MTILQLNPPLPRYCMGDDFFPKGACVAEFLIDYGNDHNILWVCSMDDGGTLYAIPNKILRAVENASVGRKKENAKIVKV